jgi:hypothetical protein
VRRRDLLLAAALLALPRAARADGGAPSDDAIARWLAGLAPLPGMQATSEWLSYAAAEDDRWARLQPRIRAIRNWSKRELASFVPPDRPILYPFGGPDAVHPLALFDDATHLLMVGLEPVAALPDAYHSVSAGYFNSLGTAMDDLHRLTFFRTHDLRAGMNRVGVLPVLVIAIVRMGGRVTRVSLPTGGRASIEWLSSDGRGRRLDYAQIDLASANLSKRSDFVASLRALAPHVTLLKAASYLLGEERFSYLRHLLLEESAVIVQDDTGIPFHDLSAPWATRLYGRYVPPVEPFADRAQPDLESAYARQPSLPLPFGIGYNVFPRNSNLLVATRSAP